MVDQSSKFYAILTQVGAAKQANADVLGIPWKITHMAVGDANGSDPTPDAGWTRLINERRRAPLNQLKVDDKDNAIIVAEQVIPAEEGGYWIREIGLYDADGDLVAVANCAPTYKPLLIQGSGRTQVVRMNLVVSSASNVQLKIDPGVVLATREYVDKEIVAALDKQDFKHSVLVATTANITLSGLQTIDGVALGAGARVLVKNQTAGKDNGIYVVAAAGWSRASDADASIEVTPGLFVHVEHGNVAGDSVWQLVTNAPIVLGTTALVFEMLAGRTGVAAGTYTKVTVDKNGRVMAATTPTAVADAGITDVYTKTEVDALFNQQDFKHSVLVASTANIALTGLQTIDGVALTAGARVLVKNQTASKDNGIYVAATAAWSRAADADVSVEVTPGLFVHVEHGTLGGDSVWQLITNAPIVLGTTGLAFEMIAGRTGVAAGTYTKVTVDKNGRVIAATTPTAVVDAGITDVYTKSEVDALFNELDFKHSVLVATTANIALSGLQTIDGVALTAGARVLVKNQTAGKDNGIYVAAATAWSRAVDADVSVEVTPGLFVHVEHGTANGDSVWQLTTNAPIALGTTALVFEVLAGRTGVAAGTYTKVTVDKNGRVMAGTAPTGVVEAGITDVYTKSEVDALFNEQDFKHSVLAATTANISLSGLQTIDGVALTAGARVLVKNQTAAKDNGIYVVAAAAWSRAADADVSVEVTPGLFVHVEHGNVGGDSVWQLITNAPIVLGTTALAFEMIVGRTGVAAGAYTRVTVDKNGRVIAGTIPNTLAGYGINDAYGKTQTYSKAELDELLKNAGSLPIGTAVPFFTNVVPPGFLEINGALHAAAAYPDLAAYLGTAFNLPGDAAGYFRMPESRGEFLRGWDHGRGVDGGRVIGSYQEDTLQNVTGNLGRTIPSGVPERDSSGPFQTGDALNGLQGGSSVSMRYNTFDLSKAARTSSETRPRNVAVMWCLKAWSAPVNPGNIDVAALVEELSALKASTPVGAIIPFPSAAVPPGYLELDGSLQNAKVYPALAAYLGTRYNTGGEPAGFFRLPDSRGEFLRGWDHGRGVDSGRELGTYQLDAFKRHSHDMDGAAQNNGSGSNHVIANRHTANNLQTSEVGGDETRPRNLAVLWCIKAWNTPVNQGSIDVAALVAGMKVATQAMVSSGVDDSAAVTSAKLKVHNAGFLSAQLTPSAGAQIVVNHNLGYVPTDSSIELVWQCVTAQGGWVAGDLVRMESWVHSAESAAFTRGLYIYAETASQLTLGCGNGNLWQLPTKTTGVAFNLVFANWRLRLRIKP